MFNGGRGRGGARVAMLAWQRKRVRHAEVPVATSSEVWMALVIMLPGCASLVVSSPVLLIGYGNTGCPGTAWGRTLVRVLGLHPLFGYHLPGGVEEGPDRCRIYWLTLILAHQNQCLESTPEPIAVYDNSIS